MVIGQLVRRYANNFDVALCKVGLATSDLTEFGCAYRGEIGGVREQDGLITIELELANARSEFSTYPGATDPLMEFDRTLGSLSFKVGGYASKTERRHFVGFLTPIERGLYRLNTLIAPWFPTYVFARLRSNGVIHRNPTTDSDRPDNQRSLYRVKLY